jgi:hypothetical protein
VTEDQIYTASKLWRQGLLISDLAAQIRVTEYAFKACMAKNRDMFPRRHHQKGRIYILGADDEAPKIRREHKDRMRWTTESGAIVTLPRISLISCPRSV